MANLDFNQILKDIKNKVYYPVYFLMGEEPFFIDVIADYLESQVLTEAEKDFNLSILYGKDTDIPTILNTAKRFPMMASHHLVIVREAQSVRNLESKPKTITPENGKDSEDQPEIKENDRKPKTIPDNVETEMLIKYIENPLKSTILVFCYKYKTIDGRKKLYKTILQNGVVHESKRLYDSQLPGWIENYIKRKGYQIEEKATHILAGHLGNDLAKVINEIQKLFISLPAGSVITSEIIENNIGISKDFNIFEFQNALGSLNKEKAFRIVKYFGDNPKANPPIMIMSMLHLFFYKLIRYHYATNKTEKGLADATGVSVYFLKDYQKAARNFPPERIEKAFSLLREYDMKLKGLGDRTTDPGQLLMELTIKILL